MNWNNVHLSAYYNSHKIITAHGRSVLQLYMHVKISLCYCWCWWCSTIVWYDFVSQIRICLFTIYFEWVKGKRKIDIGIDNIYITTVVLYINLCSAQVSLSTQCIINNIIYFKILLKCNHVFCHSTILIKNQYRMELCTCTTY